MPCGGLECVSYLYTLAAETLQVRLLFVHPSETYVAEQLMQWDFEPGGRAEVILDIFRSGWRPYATFLEKLLVEGISPTVDPFRDFYHVIPSQV
jgi:hypothetical protein